METNKEYTLFDDPFNFYFRMLEDFERAKRYILIETYRFHHDDVGRKFRDALLRKVREGVKVYILADSWGTGSSGNFFSDLIREGAEVRFFEKIKISWDIFTRNHRRNHRKVMVIDGEVAYIGSSNISGYSLSWREMVLRIRDRDLSALFEKTFYKSWNAYNKYTHGKWISHNILRSGDFEIVRDAPSIYRQQIKKKFEDLIAGAVDQIVIETPYFLPGFKLRKVLMDAAMKRGVDVRVIIPQHSDVRLVDVLRSRYLGSFHRNGVKLFFYQPGNLHAKCMLIDNRVWVLGSSNFDYRSFRYMHEMVIAGLESSVTRQMEYHINQTLRESIPFDMAGWERRPVIQKFFERILIPFRHLL